jgi:uncharacterized protein (TIGR02679 family)
VSGSGVDAERLARLLGDPALGWLLARMRRRMELGRALQGTVTLADPSPEQRRAVQRLLGRAPRAGKALNVSLGDLEEVMRRSGASPEGLAAGVLALTGPVVVREEARAAEGLAWEQAFAPLVDAIHRRAESAAGEGARLTSWLERLRGSGVVRRLESDPLAARGLLRALADVVAALPAQGEPLGRFAARVAGGAHTLDEGRPLGTLALGAARALAGLAAPGAGESPAEARREAWAAVGLLCDELSSLVLTLGLPGDEQTVSGKMLQAAGPSGQPVWLTLRQLVRDPPAWMRVGGGDLAGRTVRICENPVVVALAADRLGPSCAPLVCTNGQPGAATMTLLRALSTAGASLAHHGDFDWGGVRIGNVLHARLRLAPWRFDARAYVHAAGALASPQPLKGRWATASWDPSLTEAMRRVGRRVEEEIVVEDLLADLAE